MRKILIILGLILLTKIAFSQQIPSFELTKNGIASIEVKVDSLNASELYKRTLSWIQEFYKDEKNVSKTEIANQKIKIGGVKKNAWHYATTDMTIQYDVEYTLNIDFEYNKMIISCELGKTWDYSSGKVANSYFIDYRKIWKENGELHKIYKEAKPGIDQMMNELSHSLITYLKDYPEIESHNRTEKVQAVGKTKS